MPPRALLLAVVVVMALGVVPAASAAAPAEPLLAGAVSNSGSLSGAVSVAISGNYAYSPSYYSGVLTAVDISNHAAPFVAGQSAFSNALVNASTINIVGGRAYVVSKNANGPCLPGPSPMCNAGTNDNGTGNSLSIYDISTNPTTPTLVGPPLTDSTKLFGAYGVAVSGTDAYVAAQGCLPAPQPCSDPTVGNRFNVIDVSNPAAPAFVASVTNPSSGPFKNALSHATSVAIHGTDAYVTAYNSSRLTVIDISNPTSPAIVASITNPAFNLPADVVVGPTAQNTTYAYVANQSSGGPVTVVDVSTPSSPQVVGSVTNAALSGAYRIRLHGNFAYVSGSSAAAIAAVDVSDPTHPSVAGSLPDPAHLNVTTGLEVDSSGQYVVAASPYLSSQTKQTFPPYTPATGGPALTGTISAIRIDPVPFGVSISANPMDPTTQTSANFTFGPTDAVSSVSCSLDGAPLGFCTSATTQQYSGLAPGTHTFTVQATDAAGTVAAASYSWTVGQAPVNSGAPSISGPTPPAPSDQLIASPGNWTGPPAPTFTYQWSHCNSVGSNCVAISGATSSVYTVQASDVGFRLEVTVTGSNGILPAASARSGPTPPVTGTVVIPANSAAPSISGPAAEGQILTTSNGVWSGFPAPTFGYQWVDCDLSGAPCTVISGATSPSYKLGAADLGHALRVFVIATNSAGSSRSVSPATALVTALPSLPASLTPVITGVRQAAKTWRETARPAHTVGAKPKPKRLPAGTEFSLTLNVPASVKFRFTLKSAGRKVGGRCRTQTSPKRHQPRCTLKLAAGTLVVAAHQGANQVSFTGHLAHGKKLRPGEYTVAITATAAGKRSKTATLSFTITP